MGRHLTVTIEVRDDDDKPVEGIVSATVVCSYPDDHGDDLLQAEVDELDECIGRMM